MKMQHIPLFKAPALAALTAEMFVASKVASDPLAVMMDDPAQEWFKRRDARWIWRWQNGYTDRTDEHARRNVAQAAQRLGLSETL